MLVVASDDWPVGCGVVGGLNASSHNSNPDCGYPYDRLSDSVLGALWRHNASVLGYEPLFFGWMAWLGERARCVVHFLRRRLLVRYFDFDLIASQQLTGRTLTSRSRGNDEI